ncbi:MAG TPA: PEGA domain-containing protein [Polyangiaceae bacterium]
MRLLTRSVAVLFALLVTAEPVGVAHAQAAPDVRAQLPDPARKAWDAAKQLAGANDYKGALVEFQRAYDLSQNPRVLYNVGIVEKLLTHYARAVGAWEKELAEGAGKLTPAETAELKNAIAIVQQFVTTIDVTATEPDATLYIDDYAVGKTPFTSPVRIDVGKHTLKLTKDGFADAVQDVQVASGQKGQVSFKLEPLHKTALVSVEVVGAPSAVVVIDGKDMGPAPFKGELTADKHTIEARAPGFVALGKTIDVQYNQPQSVMIALSPERHEGRLHITAPEGAEIAVDERKVGTGTWEGVVNTTGGHQIVVTKPGFQTYSTEVFVADDATRDVNVPMNKEIGTSWVAWGVGSLIVVTGGIVAGYFIFKPANQAPISGDLAPGQTSTNRFGIHF